MLPYAEAVVSEGIRLHPVVPQLMMQALHDVELEQSDGTILSLAAGSSVLILLGRGGRHDRQRFPDPDAFRPERWLAGNGTSTPGEPPFLPFGSGPRFYPGRNLAMVEATLLVSMLARDFDIQADPSAGPVTERGAFTMFPTNLRVRVRARQRQPA